MRAQIGRRASIGRRVRTGNASGAVVECRRQLFVLEQWRQARVEIGMSFSSQSEKLRLASFLTLFIRHGPPPLARLAMAVVLCHVYSMIVVGSLHFLEI